MDYWNKQLFSYCERALDPAFWAEPLNAWSNAAFWIAALAALALWLRTPRRERLAFDLVLVALVFIIGVGSFLFHTFATRWAVLADVFPITIFMLVYLGCALKRFLGWNWLGTLLGVAVFFATLQQAEKIHCGDGPCLNGSVGYLPAFVVLLVVGGALAIRSHPAARSLIAAGLIFAVSLSLRTIDRTICDATDIGLSGGPVGTHLFWHVLNATLLYILVRAAILYGHFERKVREGI
ncbi:MAG: ceramidase domain-containing protein [Hyphomicrobiaceae bacterium]